MLLVGTEAYESLVSPVLIRRKMSGNGANLVNTWASWHQVLQILYLRDATPPRGKRDHGTIGPAGLNNDLTAVGEFRKETRRRGAA